MGCLCSTEAIFGFNNKTITRSATSFTSKNYGDVSFRSYSNQKNFYSEYKLMKNPIGSGLFGEIRLCKHFLTEKVFAVKIITKANLSKQDMKDRLIETQVKILKTIDHPSILKLHEFYEDSCNYFLIMEHIKGGDLYTKMEKCKRFSHYKNCLL